jgi:antirestriction protein ArdC
MPPTFAFRSPEAFASVLLHELGHWSGTRSRLDRDLTGRHGSHAYAREELRVEMAQVMICAEIGLSDCEFTNGAAYLADWLRVLRNDKKEVFRAATDAQRIADYLLGFHPDYRERLRATAEKDRPNDEAEPALAEAA